MEKIVLENLVNESISFSEVSRKLYKNSYYGNRQTIKKYIKEFNINTNHFKQSTTIDNRNFLNKKPLSEILVLDSYFSTTSLKKRLFKEGIKLPICEKCGQDEWWNGEKISLILDHINGKTNDLRIENLRIVCPNCNATLPTHGGKNVKRKEKLETKLSQRKVKRPEYEQLQNEINELGYCGTGRKYGVSDNAIRKWLKFYKN
jgi:hypothetical protein